MPTDVLKKMLEVCYKNGFFYLQQIKNSGTSIHYGPLGTLLRRNILREWLSSVINNTDVNVFPIEVIQQRNPLKQHLNKTAFPALPDALNNYFKILPLVEKDVPCGFAAHGSCVDVNQCTIYSETLSYSSLLKKFESRYGLCIVFFCPFKKSTDWFNYWARYRYRWWRKFSSIPSKFSMSDVIEIEKGDQQISLIMEFPWGKENLETITLHKENFFQNSCQALDLQPAGILNSAVIVCESELNVTALAHLGNSFSEKWRDGKVRELFQLHSKLAPYKVCFSVMSNCPDDLKILKDVARHLEKDLKKHRIGVFPYFDMDEVSHFSRYDEMGVPYTIVLDKKALHSGIAHLRNRDTTLQEQVHITELTPKLLKYLQMKSFDVDEL